MTHRKKPNCASETFHGSSRESEEHAGGVSAGVDGDLQPAERLILALVDRLPRDGSVEVTQGAMATTKLGADIAAEAAAAAG